jgi:hypothetical protein
MGLLEEHGDGVIVFGRPRDVKEGLPSPAKPPDAGVILRNGRFGSFDAGSPPG